MYGNPQRLYVLETGCGFVKVGITSQRGRQRFKAYRAQGIAIAREIFTPCVVGIGAERDLLARMTALQAPARGREWFLGIPFDEAVQIAQDVAAAYKEAEPGNADEFLRKAFAMLRFNDAELAVLDGYCARFGLSRSAACRRLAMESVRLAHGLKFCPSLPLNTTQQICEA